MKNLSAFILLFLLIACKQEPSFIITSEKNYGAQKLVFLDLDLTASNDSHWSISGEGFAGGIPLQKIEGHQWCFVTPAPIAAGSELEIQTKNGNPVGPCLISRDDDFIIAKIGDREVLKYAVSTQYPPDTLPQYYKRSGFIHPVKTLAGEILTSGFPRGHAHQHGIFHAWTRSHVQDSMVDFWNQQALLGDIRHKEVLEIRNGPVFSSFSVLLEYLAYLDFDTVIVSEEQWNIRLYPFPDYYLVDWHLQHRYTGSDSLVIDHYHYGGAAFRGGEQWNKEEGAYDSLVYVRTSDGKSQIDGNHTRPDWVSMHGITGNGYGGIVMYQDPRNFRYPQPVRIHPTMPYFCFAPMVSGEFVLHPDDVYEARYRILVYDGKPEENLVKLHAPDLAD